VDAVFARLADRQAIERVATDMSVPFVGIWLDAPESTLITRIERRRNDPSDADADVIRLQHRQSTGTMTWHRVEASASPEPVLADAIRHVQKQAHGALNTGISDAAVP
jgi:predicted kinase